MDALKHWLVCTLFLSASAFVTRSPLPSPRARVCTLRCVRVRSCRSRCFYGLYGLLGRPGSGYVLFLSTLPLFLPSLRLRFLSSSHPVRSCTTPVRLSFAFGCCEFLLCFTAVLRYPVSMSTNSASVLDLCAHEPPLQGASSMPEVLFWFALPAVWLPDFFQKI